MRAQDPARLEGRPADGGAAQAAGRHEGRRRLRADHPRRRTAARRDRTSAPGIAGYFKAKKPKSKVLVLDANEDIVSKKACS